MATSFRSREKCKKCRAEKKRCYLPTWPETRCNRCKKLNHLCGPFLRLGSKDNIGAHIVSQSTIEPSSLSGPAQMATHLLQEPTYTFVDISSVSDVPWATFICNYDALLSLLIAMLPVMYSIRCLQKRISVIDDNTYSDPMALLDVTYQRLIVCYKHDLVCWDTKVVGKLPTLDSQVASSYCLLTNQIDRVLEQYLRLREHASVFQAPFQPSAHEVLRETVINSVCLTGRMLHSQRLLAGIDSETFQMPLHGPHALGLDTQSYLKLQDHLHKTYRQIHHREEQIPFPAAHLAYLNGDKEIAFQLTTAEGRRILPVNVGFQNLLHLAVSARDIAFLKRLQNFDIEGLKVAAIAIESGFYTPVETATVLDRPEILKILVGDCDNVIDFTKHLLRLAIRSHSSKVSDYLLRLPGRLVRQPTTRDIAECMKWKNEECAILILPRVRVPQPDEPQFRDLAKSAEQNSFAHLAELLTSKHLSPAGPHRAIASIHQHDIQLCHGGLLSSSTSHDTQNWSNFPFNS